MAERVDFYSKKVNKRYIDCELAEKSLSQKIIEANQNTITKHLEGGLIVATEVIRELPTADVVPVVRCENCKHWWKENELCLHPKCCHGKVAVVFANSTHFCSYGERKTNNE
jgi:hypothetical protein